MCVLYRSLEKEMKEELEAEKNKKPFSNKHVRLLGIEKKIIKQKLMKNNTIELVDKQVYETCLEGLKVTLFLVEKKS